MQIKTRDPQPATRDPQARYRVVLVDEVKTKCPRCGSTKRRVVKTENRTCGIKRRCVCQECTFVYNTVEWSE